MVFCCTSCYLPPFRQTSLKNVSSSNGLSILEQNNFDRAPVPEPRRAKHKARRNSDLGQWKITSVSIEENSLNSESRQETNSILSQVGLNELTVSTNKRPEFLMTDQSQAMIISKLPTREFLVTAQ